MKPEYSNTAVKAINRINNPDKQRIKQGIDKLPEGDVVRLKGYINLYRLRIGNWRILFSIVMNNIFIEDILPRGDAYKGG